MKINKKLTLRARTSITAHTFLIPFYIGLYVFFIMPLINSLIMSFSEVSLQNNSYVYEFVKGYNYDYAFTEDAVFGTNMVNSIVEMLWKVPVTNVFAIFLAIIANQKFKGRTIIRAIFSLPLIFASGIAYECITADYVAQNVMTGAQASGGNISTSNAFADLLVASGMSSEITNVVTTLTDEIFSMAWASGVQMILYLAGLQSISPSLYEASQIEGASSWDNFWKITLPMITPIMLTCVVYTIVDSFTAASNKVMMQINGLAGEGVKYFGISSAYSWSYTILLLAILGLVMFIFTRFGRDKTNGG